MADPSPPWTVLEALRWTEGWLSKGGIPTARLDAELLMAEVLSTDRVGVYMDHDRPLAEPERAAYRELIRSRARGLPVAYLTGRREFFGLSLEVDERVLVPRPETEGLVDRALELLPADGAHPIVADVGTGSGAIACALAHERPGLKILATEIDGGAAASASRNVARLAPDRVRVVRADLLGCIAARSLGLIVSNPPYIAEGDTDGLHPHVAAHEPAVALYAGDDGLAVYRRLLPEAAERLTGGGHLVLELGAGQGEAVTALASSSGFEVVDIRPDLAGIPRVLCARKSST